MSDPITTQVNLRMKRGDTPTFRLLVMDRSGVPFNITNFGIWLTAKDNVGDADPGVFQLTSVGGDIVITNGPGGEAEITPPELATSVFTTDRTLYYDVQIRNAALTRTYTVCAGTLQVLRDVTRA